MILGLTSLGAGMLVAVLTLILSHPARSTSLGRENPPTPLSRPALAALFLAPSPTAVPASPTPLAPTPTTAPPTPTPTATIAPPVKTGSAPPPNVAAYSIAVIDEGSGALLYGRDPHRHLAPASLTKIFTALVALRYGGDLHREITVQFDQSQLVDSTLMGLQEGDHFTLEDLLYGLMLPSGNDAALAIANAVAGSESRFVALMNQEASDLGLHDSHFVNPHGLDAPDHYSSAYDLAMAARYGMLHYAEFRRLAAARAWEVHGSRTYWIYNLNRLLQSYPGADGVKIGYTDNAGRGIVASATRNGHRVYVALLHCDDIVNDSVPLLNWVFSNFTWSDAAPTAIPSSSG